MLHAPSLLLAQVVSFITVAALLFLIWRLRFPFSGPGWWFSAFFAGALGMVLLSLRNVLPGFIGVVLGNVLTLVCLVLSWHGLRLFMEKPGFTPRQWGAFGLALSGAAVGLHWFLSVHDLMQVRIALYSTFLVTIMLLTLLNMRDMVGKYRAIRLLSVLYAFYLTMFLTRAALLLLMDFADAWGSIVNVVFLLMNNMFFIAFAFCFIMMVSERLLHVVTNQYKALEEDMEFREQMENLLYHDLRSPLTPVIYLPDMLQQQENLTEDGQESARLIKTAGVRIMNLIDEALLAHKSKVDEKIKQKTPVDVAGLLEKVRQDLQPLFQEREVDVTLHARAGELEIPGDENLLYRMFANLLRNAIQASPRGEEVRIRSQREPEWVCVTIHNKGEVPVELQSRFFEKYSRGQDSRGVGLGTYSVKLAAEAHDGSVELDTDAPGETAVRVRLPVE